MYTSYPLQTPLVGSHYVCCCCTVLILVSGYSFVVAFNVAIGGSKVLAFDFLKVVLVLLMQIFSLEAYLVEEIMTEINSQVKENSLILIKQGAEARVFESSFVGKRCIVKERFSKKYRHPTLDTKLTLKRLNAEARCMTKARRLGVLTPVLYAVDVVSHTLTFEYLEGSLVKDILLDFGSHGIVEERMNDIAFHIGSAMGKLHDGGLIHGDLTTSNMLIRKDTNRLVLIDFGLSFTSTLPEDKAVDLYVLERALLSMHSSCGNVMDRILAAYRKSSKQWSSTLNKFAEVRQRGRKRTMIG